MLVDGLCGEYCVVFFFKQKTAYEMRISDWSSDVCSSDLLVEPVGQGVHGLRAVEEGAVQGDHRLRPARIAADHAVDRLRLEADAVEQRVGQDRKSVV